MCKLIPLNCPTVWLLKKKLKLNTCIRIYILINFKKISYISHDYQNNIKKTAFWRAIKW